MRPPQSDVFRLLLDVGRLTAELELVEEQLRDLRAQRGGVMHRARQGGATLESIGTAAGMTHVAARKAIAAYADSPSRARNA